MSIFTAPPPVKRKLARVFKFQTVKNGLRFGIRLKRLLASALKINFQDRSAFHRMIFLR